MQFKPLLPPSQTSKRPVNTPLNNNVSWTLILGNFTLPTWLAMGAFFQILLCTLPLRPTFIYGPALLFLVISLIRNVLQVLRLAPNPHMTDVIPGRHAAVLPGADGSFDDPERETAGGDGICVLLLSARCNHPQGIMAPGYTAVGEFLNNMMKDLADNAEEWGWYGARSYVNTDVRGRAGEDMIVHYFKTWQHLHDFAHGHAHRAGWDWWNGEGKKYPYIGLAHEVYSVPAGEWENIYLNCEPSGLGSTSIPVTQKDGTKRWVSPVVDAKKGPLKTSAAWRDPQLARRGEKHDT